MGPKSPKYEVVRVEKYLALEVEEATVVEWVHFAVL